MSTQSWCISIRGEGEKNRDRDSQRATTEAGRSGRMVLTVTVIRRECDRKKIIIIIIIMVVEEEEVGVR